MENYETELEQRIRNLPESAQQRILAEEASRLLRQAGIEPSTGRHRSQLPRNYSRQRGFEGSMLTGAYCSNRRR